MYKAGLVTNSHFICKNWVSQQLDSYFYNSGINGSAGVSAHHQLLVERTSQGLYKQSTLIKDFYSVPMHQEDLCVVAIDPEQVRQVKRSRCQRNERKLCGSKAMSHVSRGICSQVNRGAGGFRVQGSQKARGLIWRWTGGRRWRRWRQEESRVRVKANPRIACFLY